MWSLKHNRLDIQPSAAGIVSQWNKKTVSLLTGSSGIFFLSHVWQYELVQRGFYVHTVDCAIRFDAYAIAEEALRHGVSPEDIHDRITVSRCFTPYQILDEMRSILEEHVKRQEPGIYFMLAPSKQFFDGDVSADEGVFLLKKLSGIYEEFQKRSVPLMLVEKDSYSNPAFGEFFRHARQLASPLFELRHSTGSKHALTNKIRKMYSVRIAGLVSQAV